MVIAKTYYVILNNVLYVPDIMYSLISLSSLRQKHLSIIIRDDKGSKQWVLGIRQKSSGNVIMIGVEAEDGLYQAILNTYTMAAANVTVN